MKRRQGAHPVDDSSVFVGDEPLGLPNRESASVSRPKGVTSDRNLFFFALDFRRWVARMGDRDCVRMCEGGTYFEGGREGMVDV